MLYFTSLYACYLIIVITQAFKTIFRYSLISLGHYMKIVE